jgi:hypothetical protein
MISALGISVYAKSVLVSRSRVLAASVGLMCTAQMSAPLWSQSWAACGSNLCASSGANVGIGTTNASTTLVVSGVNGTIGNLQLYSTGNNAGISFFDVDASPNGRHWQIQNNYYAHGNLDVMMSTSNTGNPTTPVMSFNLNGNVGIGTTNPTKLLSVNGVIQAKEVIVNTGWSDYVFEPAYRLSPLHEVAAYIKENHHLPEIPSEAEVQQNGVGLGEMQVKLLAKIEELTLHMIQADERNNRLEQKNGELQERMARFEERGVNGGGK